MSSTGQIAGGVVGAIIGSFTPAGAWLGAQIGMTLGGLIDPPKGPTIEGPRLGDLTVQTSTYGAFIGRVKGTVAVTGNVFWLENNAIKEVAKKTKKGGKGGGSKSTTRSYSYYATFAVGLADCSVGHPMAGVKRIWIGTDLYYDAGSSDTDTIIASNAAATTFKFYPGSDTQNPDPRIQAALGVANVPAWRGLAYIVLYDLPLANYQNALPGAQVRVEVMELAAIYTYPYTAFSVPSSQQWRAAAWDGTVYCSVAYFSHLVMTSPDGLTWTQYSIPNGNSAAYQGVASDGAGTLLAFGPSATNVWRSTDHGVTWAAVTLPGFTGWVTQIRHNGSGFLAITDGGPFFTSNDGLTWVSNTSPNSGGSWGNALVWHAASEKWYACTQFGTDPIIYSSPSGATGTWSVAYTLTGDLGNFDQVCVHKGRICFVGIGTGGAGYGPMMVWSDDGSSWTQTSVASRANSLVSDGDNVWVGTSGATSSMYYSADGVTSWTAYTGPAQGTNHWLCSANGFIIATAQGGTVGFRITKQLSSASLTTLGAIVSDECLQTGILTAGDLNVTALTQSVRGYRIGALGTIRSALEPLQASWPFDIVQAGYQIKFVPRGGSAVATISAGDLGARGSSEADAVQITMPRESDPVLPRRVTFRYLDHAREYESGEQSMERSNTTAVGHRVFEAPIVLTSNEGAGKAETLLYQAWLDRVSVAFSLPGSYGAIEPADVVNLPTPEGTISVRIEAIDYTSDGRLQCKGRLSAPAIYTPAAIGAAPLVIPPATIVAVGGSVYQLLDIPYLSSQQAATGIVVAMCGAKSGWAGGSLIQTADGGATWANLADFSPPGATMGTTTNSIGAVESRLIDASSVLAVTLTSGALYSCTELAMLAGTNFFAYGADGRWEIIAARTCTLQTGTSYQLRDLLRGLFGSEWAMGTHLVGDALVLLDSSDLLAIGFSTSTIGLSRDYRGITVNRDISTDSSRAFTYRAVNLKPLSPIALTGNRDPSSNDWTLTWVRRTRSGGEWRDLVDADLGEASEAYEVDIFSDNTYTVVKRTLASTTQQCAYTSASQVSDFGSNQATLYVKIYQLSATVGRGTPLTSSITR